MTSRRWVPWVAMLSFGGIVLRVLRFNRREFWTDELEQLHNLSRPFWNMVTEYVRGMPGGFPGDYILTWPIAQLTSSRWLLIFPHLCTMVAGFYVLYRICLEDYETDWGPITVFLLYTANANLIFHALELRPYAVLPVLALVFYWRAKHSLREEHWSLADRLRWGFLVFLTLTFHLYGVLMMAAFITYHVLSSRETQPLVNVLRRPWLSTTVAAGLLALPIWLYYVLPGRNLNHGYDTFEFTGHSLLHKVSFVFGTLGDVQLRWAWKLEVLVLAASLVLPCPGRRDRWLWAVVMIALPVGLILLSDLRQHYWFIQRQFVWVMPFWGLLMSQAVEAFVLQKRQV